MIRHHQKKRKAHQLHSPDNNAEGIGDLAELIQHVNETQVASMEVLGSEPYHYDKETGFMLAERFDFQ